MAVTSASLKTAGVERAVAIFTAYCASQSLGTEDALFGIVGEIVAAIREATTPEEAGEAQRALARTFIAMAGIMNALLVDCAYQRDMDEFDILSGLAQELYRSIG